MFNKGFRLGTRGFDEVIERGSSAHAKVLYIKYLDKKDDETRLAVVVPKKMKLGAVGRNRLKRRVREAIRPLMGEIKKGIRAVVFTKGQPNKIGQREIISDFKTLLGKHI